MKIIKIRNEKMFNSHNPRGIHYYAMYWNKQERKYHAVRLTHMSLPNERKYSLADRRILKTVRIKELNKYADNGITQYNYVADIDGNNLQPNMGITVKDNVSSSTARKIKSNIKFNCINNSKQRIR